MTDNLYFKTIFHPKIKRIAETTFLDSVFTIQEITTNHPLWIVEDHTLAWRCYPLFHTQKIHVSHPNIRVIENKVVIIPKTLDRMEYITTIADTNTANTETMSLYAYAYYTKQITSLNNHVTVYCNVNDGYGNIIPDTEILIQTSTNGTDYNTINTLTTDTNGTATHSFQSIPDSFYVRFSTINEELHSNILVLTTIAKYPSKIILTGE